MPLPRGTGRGQWERMARVRGRQLSTVRDLPNDVAEVRDIVVLENIHKRYGSTHAVNDVSLRFSKGEVHAVLGENGAGKSTVGKIVGGVTPADEGRLIFDDREIRFRTIAEARNLGIAMVFQELSLVPHLTVRENICLGMEAVGHPLSLLHRRQEIELCRKLLAEYQFDFDLDMRVGDLSVANQQLVEVVKALARKPRVLILDEPTAMLGVRENEKLMRIIRNVRSQGVAIIFVTHHVEEVIEVADRVSLMKDGRLVDSFALTKTMDAAYLVGKLVGGAARKAAARQTAEGGKEVARISGLPTRGGGTIDIAIRQGQVVGLYGVVGSGCEKIGHAFVGLSDIRPSTITLNGAPFRPQDPAGASRNGVSYLPSGRAANCILPTRSIRENLMISQLNGIHKRGLVREREERDQTQRQLKRFKTRYANYDDLIVSLSGGNQQKVVFGRSLGRGGSLLVLEDPTAGVDIGAKQDIHDLLRERIKDGLSVLLISSDLLETIAICDVIYTVIGGEIVRKYDAPSLDDEVDIIADVLGSRVESADRKAGEFHLSKGSGE